MPRTIRAAPGEPARRFGNRHHLWVAARSRVLPAGLHVSRRRADGRDVDDNSALQPSALIVSADRLRGLALRRASANWARKLPRVHGFCTLGIGVPRRASRPSAHTARGHPGPSAR